MQGKTVLGVSINTGKRSGKFCITAAYKRWSAALSMPKNYKDVVTPDAGD